MGFFFGCVKQRERVLFFETRRGGGRAERRFGFHMMMLMGDRGLLAAWWALQLMTAFTVPTFASFMVVHVAPPFALVVKFAGWVLGRVTWLRRFWSRETVRATNVDRKGRPFVSLVEGKRCPVFGMQAHPEKSNFEWVTSEQVPIPHSMHAVQMSQYFATFFVGEARRNNQALRNASAELIYNYNPTYTGKTGGYFQQTYTFAL